MLTRFRSRTPELFCLTILFLQACVWGQDEPLIAEPSEEFTVKEAEQPTSSGFAALPGGLSGSGNRSPLRYTFSWIPEQSVRQQPAELGWIEQDFAATVPLWFHEDGVLLLSAGLQVHQFDTNVVLPDTGQPFPETLWKPQVGLMYIHKLQNGWSLGGKINIQSASDRPFNQLRNVTPSLLAFLRVPHDERNAWNFALFYSPLSELPYPLPGVSFAWKPSDTFQMNIGLPFQIMVKPYENLTVDFSYMILRTVHAGATYKINDRWSMNVTYDWGYQSWALNDRVEDEQRLFSYAQKLAAGVQSRILDRVVLDFSSGYIFDRFFFAGRRYADSNNDRIDVGSGWFLSTSAAWNW